MAVIASSLLQINTSLSGATHLVGWGTGMQAANMDGHMQTDIIATASVSSAASDLAAGLTKSLNLPGPCNSSQLRQSFESTDIHGPQESTRATHACGLAR